MHGNLSAACSKARQDRHFNTLLSMVGELHGAQGDFFSFATTGRPRSARSMAAFPAE